MQVLLESELAAPFPGLGESLPRLLLGSLGPRQVLGSGFVSLGSRVGPSRCICAGPPSTLPGEDSVPVGPPFISCSPPGAPGPLCPSAQQEELMSEVLELPQLPYLLGLLEHDTPSLNSGGLSV